MTRTRRGEGYAGAGAVSQHGGSLPIYLCNTCDAEVVWCESRRTGTRYLATVSYGYHQQRFYVGRNLHDCTARLEALSELERHEAIGVWFEELEKAEKAAGSPTGQAYRVMKTTYEKTHPKPWNSMEVST